MAATIVGATMASQAPTALRDEALRLFFSDEYLSACTLAGTVGGVNNHCTRVTHMPSGEAFVLRVYNNGNNTPRVAFEHLVLRELAQKSNTVPLPYRIPEARPSLKLHPYEVLSNGAACCVFIVIPGVLPSATNPDVIGRAAGVLTRALAALPVNATGVPPPPASAAPYFDLWQVHHAITRDAFYTTVAERDDWFGDVRGAMQLMVQQIRALEGALQSFHGAVLPMQLIHGDLHYDNVLVDGDTVTGLLDFEFCAYDWRAMELAICLSKYVGETDPLPKLQAFIAGYATSVQLLPSEIEALPELIRLRVLSNVVYFVGRAIAQEDSISALTSRIGSYAKRLQWLEANAGAIIAAFPTAVPS